MKVAHFRKGKEGNEIHRAGSKNDTKDSKRDKSVFCLHFSRDDLAIDRQVSPRLI